VTVVVQLPHELGIIAPERFAMGGMAEVFRAEKVFPQGGRYGVVVKHMLPQFNSQLDLVQRFRDEARLGLRLRHGNIARVLEYWEIEGHHYIVMERVDGYDLSEVADITRSAAHQIPEAVSAYFMASIASALAYMAEATDSDGTSLDLVHRDISPSNVLVSHGGVVKLIDFGVARAAEREAHTATGHLVGKYAYMSPEQIVGDELDIRSDLFALGTVIYELLTGRRAFLGATDFETFSLVTGVEPPPLTLMRPGIHPILEAAVMRCLEKDPADRYAHPEGLVIDLGRYFHDHVPHPPPLMARKFLQEFEGLDRIDLSHAGGLEEVSEPAVTLQVPPRGRGTPPPAQVLAPVAKPAAEPAIPAVRPAAPARHRAWKAAIALAAVGVVAAVIIVALSSGPTAGPAGEAGADREAGMDAATAAPERFAEISIEDDETAPTPAEPTTPPPVVPPDRDEPPAEITPVVATTTGADAGADAATGTDAGAETAGAEGTITVSSIPWVDVWVDGQRLGRTPLVDYPLPVGPHEFEYRNSERGWQRSEVVTIVPGPNREIRIRLDE